MEKEKTVTFERLFAEHHSTGEAVEIFRLKDMDKFLCPDCNIMMKRVLPSTWFCVHCGNLLSEELGNERLNFPDTYHLTNLSKKLFTVVAKVGPIEQHVKHDITLKSARTRKKTWLEKEKGKKTVQITEEEFIEEDRR
jgi:rubredoxin